MEEFPSSITAEHIDELTVDHTEHIAALNKQHHSTSRLTLNITALKEFEKVFPVNRGDLFNLTPEIEILNGAAGERSSVPEK